jgi:hypothetical protein
VKSFLSVCALIACAVAVHGQGVAFSGTAPVGEYGTTSRVYICQPESPNSESWVNSNCVLVSVYSDQALKHGLANPIQPNSLGVFTFFAPSGTYVYKVNDPAGTPYPLASSSGTTQATTIVNGTPASVAVGAVQTLTAGSTATVQNVGSGSSAVLNFGIPAGATGPPGAGVSAATSSLAGSVVLPDGITSNKLGSAAAQTANAFSFGTGYASSTYTAGAGGVTAGTIVSFDASGNAITATSGTSYAGIAATTAAQGSAVEVVRGVGIVSCVFDGVTAVGDVAIPSSATLGECSDSGLTSSSDVAIGTPVIGVIQSVASGAGQAAQVRLHPPGSVGLGSLPAQINANPYAFLTSSANGHVTSATISGIVFGNGASGPPDVATPNQMLNSVMAAFCNTTTAGWFYATDGCAHKVVTSLAISPPPGMNVTNSPVTDNGTIYLTWGNQPANRFFRGPQSGADAVPTYDYIYASDLATAVFGASGSSHSVGAVPDPGATASTVRYLREDGTWVTPATTFPSATGANQVPVSTGAGTTYTAQPLSVTQVTGAAPLASPALTGTPTAPTPSPGDATTKIATMAALQAAISSTSSASGAVAQPRSYVVAGTSSSGTSSPSAAYDTYNTEQAVVFPVATNTVRVGFSNYMLAQENCGPQYTVRAALEMPTATSLSITAYSITSAGVITFTAANSLTSLGGSKVQVTIPATGSTGAFATSTFLNGQTFTVTSANSTTFTSSTNYGTASATEAATGHPSSIFPLQFPNGTRAQIVEPCGTPVTAQLPVTIAAGALGKIRANWVRTQTVSTQGFPGMWSYGVASTVPTAVSCTAAKGTSYCDGIEQITAYSASDAVTTSGSNVMTTTAAACQTTGAYNADLGQTVSVTGVTWGPNAAPSTTIAACTSTTSFKLASTANQTASAAAWTKTGADKSVGGYIRANAQAGPGLWFVAGTTAQARPKAVGFIGDSIPFGVGSNTCYGSWAVQSMNPAAVLASDCTVVYTAVPFVTMANYGDTYESLAQVHASRWTALPYVTDTWDEDFTNSLYASGPNGVAYTAAQAEANAIPVWQQVSLYSISQYQTTVIPRVTGSTSQYMDTVNQTPNSTYEPQRVALNQWLRDGAPLSGAGTTASPFTPAATGTAGATRTAFYNSASTLVSAASGPYTHPLAGVFDIAPAIEYAQDDGLWKPDPNQRGTVRLLDVHQHRHHLHEWQLHQRDDGAAHPDVHGREHHAGLCGKRLHDHLCQPDTGDVGGGV